MTTKEEISIIFMGTPEFSLPSFEAVHKKFGIRAVVTVPDKPAGRGRHLHYSPVKEAAIRSGLPLLQPESLKDEAFISELTAFSPDIIMVVAFRILPKAVYSLAKIGAFNIHGSVLPKYRGAAPLNWAIINGEKQTGLTSFLLDAKVDTGSILLKKEFDIPDGSTAGDLHDSLMPISAELGVETIDMLIKGDYKPLMQDESQASPAPKIFPEQCKIDWAKQANSVRNFIHGVSPHPGAWTHWNGLRLKIYRVEISGIALNKPGSYEIEKDKIMVNCEDRKILITELQPEGKKTIKSSDFLRGYRGDNSGIFD